MQELVGQALTAMQAPPTQNESVTMTAWAKFLEFDISGKPDVEVQLRAMLESAARFIRAINRNANPYWLTYLGTSGAGKTYLARRIWMWFKKSPHFRSVHIGGNTYYAGSWIHWPNMASDLLSNQGYESLKELQDERLIVLDEIGADRDPSGHVRDCLARVLSARVGKWTIITSNKTLGDVQRDIDTRISSRMIRDGNVVVDVNMLDYALRCGKLLHETLPP